MAIKYTTDITRFDYKKLQQWRVGDGEAHTVAWYKKLMQKTTFTAAAFDGDKMVGYIRAFGDGMIWMICNGLTVDLEYRKRGIGAHLVKMMIKYAKKNKYQTVRLFAAIDKDPGLYEFYKKLNFERHTNAMGSKDMEW